MRVGDFLHYIATLKGVPRRNLAAHIQQWLERIELPDVYRKKCEELSKGMQQKVQFLAAILHDPELLIFDEPFSGLDPVNTELLNRLIRDLHSEGKTIIFSTHILHQAEQICDRIFLINHGVKLLDASFDEIRERFDPRTILVEPVNGRIEPHGIDGLASVRRMPDSAAQELVVQPGADPQMVMQQVLQRHAVRSIELRRLSLEEVFVQLVQQDEGADAAEQARVGLSHV